MTAFNIENLWLLRTRQVCRKALSGIARFRLGSAAFFTKISLRCDFP